MANGEEFVPVMRSNDAASVGSEETWLKVEGPKKVASRVGERDSDGPSNELGWVWNASRREELDIAKVHNTVSGADQESIPLRPPTASRMTHGLVGGVLQQELDMVDARGSAVDAFGIGGGQSVVDTNEIPTGTSGAFRKI